MSQPLSFGPNKDPLAVPILSDTQLHQVFIDGARPKDNMLLGIEYEMFAHDRIRNTPLSYEGPTSISSLFYHMAHKSDPNDPLIPVMEENNIVALSNQNATIALEPGGQIELAMSPKNDLVSINEEFYSLLTNVKKWAHDINIDLFSMGMHPLAKREDMAMVKKQRYLIMHNQLNHRKGLGHDMMKRTCSIQLNLDYFDEEDFVKKTRLSASLMPFFAILCSSSAFLEGQKTSLAVQRAHIWLHTDHSRTGFPKVIFDEDFGYKAWVNYALMVPMYFIRRENTYIDVRGSSFKHFITHGLKGHKAQVRDFVDHLTTIFSEVRLKPFLELRSADSLPGVYVMALSSLAWALFYNPGAYKKIQDLFQGMNHKELLELHDDVIKYGRKARFRDEPVFLVLKEILSYAETALIKDGTAHYLKPLLSLVEKDITIAELLRDQFDHIDKKNLSQIIALMSPLSGPLL